MFEDSLFASNARPVPRRGFATVLSFGIQAVMLTVLVMLPLYYTDALPMGALHDVLVTPTAPVRHVSDAMPKPHVQRKTQSNMENGQVVTPIVIPPHAADIHDRVAPDNGGGDVGPAIPGSIPSEWAASPRTNITRMLTTVPVVAPTIATHHGPVRISHIDEGMLLRRVEPVYPRMAIQIRQQGVVTLQATIARDGTIQNLRVLNGPPLLIGSAMDAVRQWRYRPYLLNNEPVEVETQIMVRFTLN